MRIALLVLGVAGGAGYLVERLSLAALPGEAGDYMVVTLLACLFLNALKVTEVKNDPSS